MTKGQNGAKPDIVLISSAVFLSMSIALAAILQASTMRHAATSDGRIEPKPAILASFSDDVHAKPDVFNKGLSLKVDPYTTIQRVDFKKGY